MSYLQSVSLLEHKAKAYIEYVGAVPHVSFSCISVQCTEVVSDLHIELVHDCCSDSDSNLDVETSVICNTAFKFTC